MGNKNIKGKCVLFSNVKKRKFEQLNANIWPVEDKINPKVCRRDYMISPGTKSISPKLLSELSSHLDYVVHVLKNEAM